MCRPTSRRPWRAIVSSAAGMSVGQMPCLLCSPPVLVLRLWPWPKPGLMRSQTRWPFAPAALLEAEKIEGKERRDVQKNADLVYSEGMVGFIYLDRAEDIGRYHKVFEHLSQIALPPDRSAELMLRASRAYENPVRTAS